VGGGVGRFRIQGGRGGQGDGFGFRFEGEGRAEGVVSCRGTDVLSGEWWRLADGRARLKRGGNVLTPVAGK
jgi:hypothetical protein